MSRPGPEPRRSLTQRLIDVLRKVLVPLLLLVCGLGLPAALPQGTAPAPVLQPGQAATPVAVDKPVFLVTGLDEEDLLTFTTAMAGSSEKNVLLLNSAAMSPYNSAFVEAYAPRGVTTVNKESAGTIRRSF